MKEMIITGFLYLPQIDEIVEADMGFDEAGTSFWKMKSPRDAQLVGIIRENCSTVETVILEVFGG